MIKQKTPQTYSSDSTDAEWALIVPYLPSACLVGRPMKWDWRTLLDGIFYILTTGCQWRQLPKDFAPWQTTYRYFRWLSESRWWQSINDLLSSRWRVEQGRQADPTAGCLDSQTVQSTPTGSSHGYDAGKKTKGIKRHILVDTEGLLLTAVVHDAAIQDYNGAALVFERAYLFGRVSQLQLVWADGIYDKVRVHSAAAEYELDIQCVKRNADTSGFKLLPRRWVIERTFGWLSRQRRLARDYERLAHNAESFIYLAMSRLLLKRLAASEF